MQRNTVIALGAFLALLGLTYYMMSRPEKGQRTGKPERPVPAIAAGTIKQLSITSKGTTVVLTRPGPGKDWRISKPVDYAADKYAADTAAEKMEKLEFGDLVSELPAKHAEYEVDDKAGVRVVASDGAKTLADVTFGKVEGDFTMLRVAGKNQVYQAVGSLRFVLERELKNWRQRTIISFKQEDARKLEVTTGESTVVLSRPEDKKPWKVESSPTPIDRLDEAAVSTLLSSLYAFSAVDFADGVKPEKSGLDKPTAKVTASFKSGAPVTLLIGGHQGDDYWVQKQGEPQVFTVKKYSIENLMRRPIDFRDKTVLSFKAEDVVGLTLEQTPKDKPKEKESVKLVLKGKEWQVGGKAAKEPAKLKTAVEALAALKAEAFATASEEDLGMDAPEWVIEILLKDRTKHVLTIGSKEKDGVFGLKRKGVEDLFALRKFSLDRFCLGPKTLKP